MTSGRGGERVLAEVTADPATAIGEPTIPPNVLDELKLGDAIKVNEISDTYEVTDTITDCPLPVVYLERAADRAVCQLEVRQRRRTSGEEATTDVYLVGHQPEEAKPRGTPVWRLSRSRQPR